METGNNQIKAGESYQTGEIFIKSDGTKKHVKRKFIDFGALPNATTKNVAHGIADLDVEYAKATISANDGTTNKQVDVAVTVTNVSITAAGNESAFSGIVTLDYI